MWVAQQISCTLGIYITILNSSKVTVLKQKQDNFMGEVSTIWRSVLKALGLGTACTPLLADWARLASSGIAGVCHTQVLMAVWRALLSWDSLHHPSL